MKRKELLSKSLAVGLAVAMAVASMSTSGGLLAPIEVYADVTPVTATKEMFVVKDAEGSKVITLANAAEDAEICLVAAGKLETPERRGK